jgi:hypothetical protein
VGDVRPVPPLRQLEQPSSSETCGVSMARAVARFKPVPFIIAIMKRA